MLRVMMKSKIHRATITQAELHYEGSLTISAELMRAADILPYEMVHVYNVSNGNRFETYAIEGEENTGVICLNGAAARQGGRFAGLGWVGVGAENFLFQFQDVFIRGRFEIDIEVGVFRARLPGEAFEEELPVHRDQSGRERNRLRRGAARNLPGHGGVR